MSYTCVLIGISCKLAAYEEAWEMGVVHNAGVGMDVVHGVSVDMVQGLVMCRGFRGGEGKVDGDWGDREGKRDGNWRGWEAKRDRERERWWESKCTCGFWSVYI